MNYNINKNGGRNINGNNNQKKLLMEDLVENITKDNFVEWIEMDKMTKEINSFKNQVTTSALRKVYDGYLSIIEDNNKNYEIEKQIWIAKIAYQEKRKVLPFGFAKALKQIEQKIGRDLFKKFLEVLVAYHKYLGGKES